MYFAHPIDFFAVPILEKKIQIYQIWFLFGAVILIRAILEQSINNKMVNKILVGMSTNMYLH